MNNDLKAALDAYSNDIAEKKAEREASVDAAARSVLGSSYAGTPEARNDYERVRKSGISQLDIYDSVSAGIPYNYLSDAVKSYHKNPANEYLATRTTKPNQKEENTSDIGQSFSDGYKSKTFYNRYKDPNDNFSEDDFLKATGMTVTEYEKQNPGLFGSVKNFFTNADEKQRAREEERAAKYADQVKNGLMNPYEFGELTGVDYQRYLDQNGLAAPSSISPETATTAVARIPDAANFAMQRGVNSANTLSNMQGALDAAGPRNQEWNSSTSADQQKLEQLYEMYFSRGETPDQARAHASETITQFPGIGIIQYEPGVYVTTQELNDAKIYATQQQMLANGSMTTSNPFSTGFGGGSFAGIGWQNKNSTPVQPSKDEMNDAYNAYIGALTSSGKKIG